MDMWNVKAVYASGGHYLTDLNNNRLRFNSESAANDYLAINKIKGDSNTSYIIVRESN